MDTKSLSSAYDDTFPWRYYHYPDYNNSYVYKYCNFFTPQEVDDIIDLLKPYRQKMSAGLVSNDDAPHNPSVRSSEICFLHYEDVTLSSLYDTIHRVIWNANTNNFQFNLTSIEPLQYSVYRGSAGGMYTWHPDSGNIGTNTNTVRKLSFSLLLSEPEVDFIGGELELFGEHDLSDIKKGSFVFFPSFMMHRVRRVTSGIRQSIVGWINGPNWT